MPIIIPKIKLQVVQFNFLFFSSCTSSWSVKFVILFLSFILFLLLFLIFRCRFELSANE